jgi:16S rRNA C967 or C1407 C5-methylase (RsmB/RsmF family)
MTKNEPTNLMRKCAAALFPDSVPEQALFLDALLSPPPRGNAVVRTAPAGPGDLPAVDRASLPAWLPLEIDLIDPGVKIGRSGEYLEGNVYPLDFSSVITGSAMLVARESLPAAPDVFDLCAAPGGKSILASVLLKPGLLLANEVERKRLGILRHNLSRCRVPHVWTQRMQPEEIAPLIPRRFDLCLVDAPCSGQSLLAKGIENPGCFHPSTVKGNARRQLRILESAVETVAAGGFLLYTTCTFSLRENEGVIEKLLERADEFEAIPVPHLAEFASPFSDHPCYRIYPHRTPGAGGFAALLRRKGEIDRAGRESLPPPLQDYPVAPSSSDDEAS